MMQLKLNEYMMNTSIRNSLLTLAILIGSQACYAQFLKKIRIPESDIMLIKTGPLLGVEQGKYFNANFGVERQWQQIKLKKPHTNAVNLQFDYNFTQKQMGSQIGYWYKAGRLNLTYGGRLAWHTDFDGHHLFGIAPNVGYKLLQAHFQLGVNIQQRSEFVVGNTFYASLRWVFINDRDFNRNKKK